MKKNAYAKLIQLFMGVLLVASTLIGAVGGLEKAFAAPGGDTVDVTLHKLYFKDASKKVEKQNTGESMTDWGTDAEPLDGVEFTVYDVTKQYYDALKALKAANPAATDVDLAKMAAEKIQGTAGNAPTGGIKGDTGPTASGIYKFAALDAKKTVILENEPVEKDAVYVFVESDVTGAKVGDKSVTITDRAQNMVLALPVFTTADPTVVNKDIHLYPKNASDSIEISKARDEYSHNYGEAIDFRITGKLPNAYKEKRKDATGEKTADSVVKSFTFTDKYDASLEYVTNSGSIDGLTVKDDYTITTEGSNPFTVSLTQAGINKLAELKQQTFVFKYQMRIKADAAVDTEFKNTVGDTGSEAKSEVQYNTDGLKTDLTDKGNTVIVATGGYKFKKVDFDDNAKFLKDAKFHVEQKGAVLYVNQGVYKFLNLTDTDKTDGKPNTTVTKDGVVYGLVQLTSNATGEFEIKGLKDGDYELVETTVPEGYVTPTENHKFTVTTGKQHETNAEEKEAGGDKTEGSLLEGTTPVLTGGDLLNSEITGSYAKGASEVAYLVKNTKKVGFLPSTGGKGIVAIAIVGISMMVLGAVYFGRKFKKA